MIQVIPAIIAQNFKELEEKIKAIEGFCEWAQIDVMDGKFVLQKTFNRPAELANLKTSIKLEAHLMIEHPWDFIDSWITAGPLGESGLPAVALAEAGIKRILVHYEAIAFRLDEENIIEDMAVKCHMANCEFGIVLNPETPIDDMDKYILKIDTIQLMGVKPGRAGQNFQEHILDKIQDLRRQYPGARIEVDGGVNLETAPKILKAGADILVAGAYIWESEDKKKAIESLRAISG